LKTPSSKLVGADDRAFMLLLIKVFDFGFPQIPHAYVLTNSNKGMHLIPVKKKNV
jgi:hypothetical protein